MRDVLSPLIAGRYQLVELIGQGGMAEVWHAHDQRRDMPVAVKIMNPLVSGVTVAERFAREARAAAQIVHPNVVTVLDAGQDQARRFLVMELLSGRNLADELAARGPLPVAEVCRLLVQAAAGLEAAHRAGVMHRDIKPANLHLTSEGTLKVVDFGVAHVADEAARLTVVGTVVGTAAYLAPEQIDGSGGEAPCDLYALGCVCYELLCGQPPFTGSAPELVYQHVHRSPVPPSRHRPDISVELDRLILAMLAKDPAQRPPSAAEVRRVLATVAVSAAARAGVRAGDTAVLDAPAGGPPSSTPAETRHLLVQLAVAMAALTLVAVGVAALFSGTGGRPEAPRPSVVPSETASAMPPQATATPSAAASTARPTPVVSTRPTARGWREWLADFDRAVLAQQGQGGIEPGLADKVHKKIGEIAKKLSEGKDQEARKKLRELGRDLAEAGREGELATDGPLSAFLNRSGLTAGGDD